MAPAEKREYKDCAKINLSRRPFLHDDVIGILKRVNGSISWKNLEWLMNGIVCHTTIRRHVMSLESFKYRKNRVFPLLDEGSMLRRRKWAEGFWVFWETAKILVSTKILYPSDKPENRLRVKGEYYWSDAEVVGSANDTEKKPKYPQ
uniref:Uncharacterized protein n=1 Tax=Ditylum brightwellii TaxID=49249 RepID=A0A7S4QRW9_9STRA